MFDDLPFTSSQVATALKIFIIIIVVVKLVFFNDVEFNWIESDQFQISPALFARDDVTLVRVRINMDIRITFGARSCGHFPIPPALALTAVAHPLVFGRDLYLV